MDAGSADRALDCILHVISEANDYYPLAEVGLIAEALAASGARVDENLIGCALDRLLDSIGRTTDPYTDRYRFQPLGRAAQALAARADASSAVLALEFVLAAIGRTTGTDQLRAFGQAAQALVVKGSLESTVPMVVNALKLPTFVYHQRDEILIAALRTRHPDMPDAERGFWAAVDWLRERYPNIDLDAPPQ